MPIINRIYINVEYYFFTGPVSCLAFALFSRSTTGLNLKCSFS